MEALGAGDETLGVPVLHFEREPLDDAKLGDLALVGKGSRAIDVADIFIKERDELGFFLSGGAEPGGGFAKARGAIGGVARGEVRETSDVMGFGLEAITERGVGFERFPIDRFPRFECDAGGEKVVELDRFRVFAFA